MYVENQLAKSGWAPQVFDDESQQIRKSTNSKHQHSNSTLSDISITSMDKPPMESNSNGVNVSVVVSTTSDNASPVTTHTHPSTTTPHLNASTTTNSSTTASTGHSRRPSTTTTSNANALTQAQRADLDAAEKWIQEMERKKVERRLEREAEERYLRGEDQIWVGPREGGGR